MRLPGQHRDPLAARDLPVSLDRRPEPGPIAVLPHPTQLISDAVREGGGSVAPLSEATRGIVWLDGTVEELQRILHENRRIGWVQLPFAGVERYRDLFAAQVDRRFPLWTSAKGSFAEPVAEHAVALVLAGLRQLPQKSRSSSWAIPRQGISLFGRRVVIVGAGGVAVEIMRLLAPFEVEVTIVRRGSSPLEGAARTVSSDRLLSVLSDADVVILAAAATDETAQLIGVVELATMQPTTVLVNIARGSLVDTDALLASLHSGHLWAVGLDVTDPEPLPDGHPLWDAPRTIITSHSADTAEMIAPLLAERVRLNVRALHTDSAFVGVVDPLKGY
jgi:phosphoglycerate dehydrogenase-like enzyme